MTTLVTDSPGASELARHEEKAPSAAMDPTFAELSKSIAVNTCGTVAVEVDAALLLIETTTECK